MGDVNVTSVPDVTGWAEEHGEREGERGPKCLSEKLLQEEEKRV